MIGCDMLIILNTLKFKKFSTKPFEFLSNELKVKYYESPQKYVEVLVDIKEFEIGEVIQLKIFNYEHFVKVVNIFSEDHFEEKEEKCICEYEGCADMDCPFARMAYTVRHIF